VKTLEGTPFQKMEEARKEENGIWELVLKNQLEQKKRATSTTKISQK